MYILKKTEIPFSTYKDKKNINLIRRINKKTNNLTYFFANCKFQD